MALFVSPFAQYTDASGNPGSGYKLYFYQTGTTTPITIYSDSLFATPTANPAIADSAGQWAAIYVNTGSYKVVMKSAADVTIRTADPVSGAPVSGPASSTDNAFARFDGTTGKILQNSVVLGDDSGNVTGVVGLTMTGNLVAVGGAFSGAVSGTTGTFTGAVSGTTGTFTGAVSGTTGTFTGIVRSANGTAAAPTYNFTSSTTTGMYRTAADGGIGFSVGGVTRGAFHNTGFTCLVGSAPDQLISADGPIEGCSMSSAGAFTSYIAATQSLAVGRLGDGAITSWRRSGVAVGSISVSAGATAYNTSSDKRLKTPLRQFDSGSIIDRLKVGEFNWLAEPDVVGYGVLAQDAYKVYPTAFHKPEKRSDHWGADYSKFVPLLLAEIKDLRRRLAEAGL